MMNALGVLLLVAPLALVIVYFVLIRPREP